MDKWLIDSGASSHMTWEKNILTGYKRVQKVSDGDGRTLDVAVGDVHIVLLVPELACNLFSVRAGAARGNHVKFGRSRCWIQDVNGKLCGTGTLTDKLYRLDCQLTRVKHMVKDVEQHAALATEDTDIDLWHQRLGHLCEQQMRQMVKDELIKGMKFQKSANLSFCEGCVEGKIHKKPFSLVGVHSSRKLQLVHSDVCGPIPVESLGGHKYFVTFIQ